MFQTVKPTQLLSNKISIKWPQIMADYGYLWVMKPHIIATRNDDKVGFTQAVENTTFHTIWIDVRVLLELQSEDIQNIFFFNSNSFVKNNIHHATVSAYFFYLSILFPFHVYFRASKRLFYTAFRGFRACNIATTIANQNSYKSTGPSSHVYFVLPRMCSKPLVGYVCIRKLCMCSVFTRSQNPVCKF